MNRCAFCSTIKKERAKWIQCSILIPMPRKPKKRAEYKKINICRYPEISVYCPSCEGRARAESIHRHDPAKWMKYMEDNPVYRDDLCGHLPVTTLKKLLFQERGKI